MKRSAPPSGQDAAPDVPVGPSAADGVLDEGALLTTVGGNRRLAAELAEIFLRELESRMPDMEKAVVARDNTRIQFLAHTLMGSAASLSATQVTGTARKLESMALTGKLAKIDAVFARLEHEIARLGARLTTFIREG